MKVVMRRVAQMVLVCCLGLAVVMLVGLRWGWPPFPKPPPGVRLTPLRAPLTGDQLATNNAAYYYVEATRALGARKLSCETQTQLDRFLLGDSIVESNVVDSFVSETASARAWVRQGARLEFCQMPLGVWDESRSARPRQLARSLCCEGALAARRGEEESALQIYLLAHKYGQDETEGSAVMGWLIGIGVQQIATRSLRATLLQCDISERLLRETQRTLASRRAGSAPLPEVLRYELLASKQLMDSRVFSTNTTSWSISKPALHRTCDAAFGDLIALSTQPLGERDMTAFTAKWDTEGKSRWYLITHGPIQRLLVGMLMPSLAMLGEKEARARVDLEATILCCSLQAYTLVNGHPPDSLAELVPAYMAAVPCDPFDGQPLRYRRDGSEWVVWSVGADRRDDRAERHEFKYRQRGERRSDGDIFFKSTEPADDLAALQAAPR